jgi:hypothetical protein
MTDPVLPSPRPVSFPAVAAIFVLFSLFGVLTLCVYLPGRPPAPQNETPEHLPKDMVWRATPAARKAFLAELRTKQAEQGLSYGWVDRKAGVVQLPVERAMELTASELGVGK